MTAGRGVVHSERSSEEDMTGGSRLHGIQTWLVLPVELEETEPSFDHYAAGALPVIEKPGATVRVIAGEVYGQRSPVATSSETVYAEVDITAGASLELAIEVEELAAYVAAGEIRIGGQSITMGTMAVLNPGVAARIDAQSASKVMILGGAALPGERHLYWNLVSSRPERIEQAKDDWRDGRFDKVPGDDEFIPLPD
jgi:redox-sensitive bicupin YhaK (pirin superfamily)